MSCTRLVAQHCDTDWMHSNIQIDTAGPVVRLDGPTRTQMETKNSRKEIRTGLLVSCLSRAPAFPSLHSFRSACLIQIARFRLFSRVLGFSFGSDSTSSEQIGRSNNPLYTTSLRSCCCSGLRCCCMHVSGRFLLVSCSSLWACCCLLLVSYHSLWACCCCLLVPAAAACCRFRRLH